jgi:hypothetical protein
MVSIILNSTPRSSTMDPLIISKSDCVDPATNLKFQYSYGGNQANHLEVWGLATDAVVGDCFTGTNRSASNGCLHLLDASPDIVGAGGYLTVEDFDVAQLVASVTNCEDSAGTTVPNTVTLFIMAIASETEDAVDYCTYDAQVDLLGPPPPTDVSAGPGDGALLIDFSTSTEEDTNGYSVYCDDGTGVSAMGGGGAGPTTTGVGGAGGAGGAGVTSTVAAGSLGCGISSVLIPGQDPDPRFLVASQNAPTISAKTSNGKPMVNGQTYACAVAALDIVGNQGKLSNVICGTPQPNDDFFGQYRNDGGQAGGGLCSMSRGSTAFAAVAGALGAALLAFGARRRPRRRRRSGS